MKARRLSHLAGILLALGPSCAPDPQGPEDEQTTSEDASKELEGDADDDVLADVADGGEVAVPPCGLLGVPCPDGFECTPLEHTFLDNDITEFCYAPEEDAVFVPAGEFWMGNNPAKGEGVDPLGPHQDANPQHLVATPAYVVMRNVATIGEYVACLQSPGSSCSPLQLGQWDDVEDLPEFLKLPVFITFRDDADAFCAWKAGATGEPWRVCSEAEWEKAARGGCETLALDMAKEGTTCAEAVRIFPWGDFVPVCDLGISGYCNWPTFDLYRPHVAGSRPAGAGPYGALDMWGNVKQWVADCDHYGNYEGAPSDGSAWVADCVLGYDCLKPGGRSSTVPWMVARGSSWACEDFLACVTSRRTIHDKFWDGCSGSEYGAPQSHHVGIRCCRDL